jgi:hypothetical protein
MADAGAYLVLNVTDCHNWSARLALQGEIIHIPPGRRSGVVQLSRAAAEREAARLACQTGGRFAVFELCGVVEGRALANEERVEGMGPYKARVPKWMDVTELP